MKERLRADGVSGSEHELQSHLRSTRSKGVKGGPSKDLKKAFEL